MLGAPLPNCSVVFFHHVEKTAGTTLRALFQRHAQLGLFDLISFVGRQNRLQLQLVLQRLHSLLRSGTLQGLRLAVELHVAGDLTFPYTLYYTMPDLVLIREQARDTLSPLCVWPPAPDCGTRMALGSDPGQGAPASSGEELLFVFGSLFLLYCAGAEGMWRLFDLVGVTEMFDEFARLSTAQLGRRLKKLSAANEALSARAVRQERKLRGARSALASCVGCSGDVVPEFDLGGCWPLWEQFAPDERRFQCSRTWTTDPAYRDPAVRPGYREKPSVLHTPMACWRTCWTPTGLVAANEMRHRTHAGDTAHCTAPCPAAAPLPLEWRAEWDRELAASAARPGASQDLAALAAPFRARARGGWHSSYLTRQIFRVF
ncbi:hypothetical protein EMIHUDRAFT_247167 [Emiliania huxleyi CCMP1516]|uniref:Uncharacterized protein n=2 Tax=Emiliania huxleyi TaxID=2903 RepID=A0A0D3IP52_EMIH1|nr:hypothetical protein EMIHUDRAFT_247167 [Emiliania huxleyi CCMP1516]EOD13037.1 hypothetical protein EMIHUDRAFT_247167 [Emiliania huxleyi CCMP1516]|eukprot:XP_005765466.1 hypothetical protein EMIHUDRAFT_247167 [Emiliania huxleyi CCMP1516]